MYSVVRVVGGNWWSSRVYFIFLISLQPCFFFAPIANLWTDVMYWLQSCPFQIWVNTDLMNLFRSFMQNGAHSSLLFHCMSNLYRSLTDRHVANFCWFFPRTNWFVQIHSVTRLKKSKCCTSALATCYSTNIENDNAEWERVRVKKREPENESDDKNR